MTEPPRSEWPATFAELNGALDPKNACARCRDIAATHTVTITVAKVGVGRGGLVSTRKAKLCEPCAVRIYGPVAKAFR